MQGVRPAFHYPEAAPEIADCVGFSLHVVHARQQAARDRLDGGQRIGKFVSQDPDETLPCGLLFFLKRQAHVGEKQQGMRHPILAENRFAQQPARRF